MIFKRKITPKRLKSNGWGFIKKCPYTGKSLYWKDKVLAPHLDIYMEVFTFDPITSVVKYNGGEFSSISKKVNFMNELNSFYKTLRYNGQIPACLRRG